MLLGYTTVNWVSYCLDLQSQGYYADSVANWWVGDYHASAWYPYPEPWGHFWFYGNSGNDIQDNLIFTEATNEGTQSSYEFFNFIWTCANGGRYWTEPGIYDPIGGITSLIPNTTYPVPTNIPVNTNTMYGFREDQFPFPAIGMPFAWTGRTDLSLNGYSSPDYTNYCYIGFEGPSPFMINPLPGAPTYQAWQFVDEFYYHVLFYDSNTIIALDDASDILYGDSFDSTALYQGWWNEARGYFWYSRMYVLCNGNVCPAL